MTNNFTASKGRSIACFVSPHGYGHAARVSGIMAAIQVIDPSIRFEIFSTIPPGFFQESLSGSFGYHSVPTDVGFVQKTPLYADLEKTIAKLDAFLPYDEGMLAGLTDIISRLDCEMVICDIAPMGIAVAQKAGVPSILVENFTWDWLYLLYADFQDQFKRHIEYLRDLFDSADYLIQAEPVCFRKNADLICPPISRKNRIGRQEVRRKLDIPAGSKLVTITMGGVPDSSKHMKDLSGVENVIFVIPGAAETVVVRQNLILLPHDSDFFHPDLMYASDAVIGKVGYSTLAEVYHAGAPFAYISRPAFRESEVLVHFIEKNLSCFAIKPADFENRNWSHSIPAILELPRKLPEFSNGAEQAADFIFQLLRLRDSSN